MKTTTWKKQIKELLNKCAVHGKERDEMEKAFMNAMNLKDYAEGLCGQSNNTDKQKEISKLLLLDINEVIGELTVLASADKPVYRYDTKTGKFELSVDDIPIENELETLTKDNADKPKKSK